MIQVSRPIILDLCGGSGSWSRPYKEAGYDVRLITLPWYDVLTYRPPPKARGVLCAPPCTEFAVSGARWWATKEPWMLRDALATVDACLRIVHSCSPKWWALENPIGRLRRLRRRALGEPRLVFDPWEFGDPYTKRTLLWGKFRIPKRVLVDPQNPQPGSSFIHRLPPSSERQELRSITPPGFARAFFEANP